MDPLTIGAAVVTILTPYVADAGKELVRTVGETGVQKTKELMQWLKAKFAGDPVAATDLSRFEKDPAGYAKPLQDTIVKKVNDDPAFSAEITKRVGDLGPTIAIIQRFDRSVGAIGVLGDVSSGRVSVEQTGTIAVNPIGIKGKVG